LVLAVGGDEQKNHHGVAAQVLLKAQAFVERNQRIVAGRNHQLQQRLVFAPVPTQFAHRAHQVGGTEIEPQLGG